jgi:glycine/D-amino acid oxidase-like deaminating enzyme
VERALSVARRSGIEHERLDEVGLARRFPQFKVSVPMPGYYEETGGFVRPEACVAAQLLLARRGGAALEFGVVAEDLVREIQGVRVVTDRGDFLARRVVVAAGACGGANRSIPIATIPIASSAEPTPDRSGSRRPGSRRSLERRACACCHPGIANSFYSIVS